MDLGVFKRVVLPRSSSSLLAKNSPSFSDGTPLSDSLIRLLAGNEAGIDTSSSEISSPIFALSLSSSEPAKNNDFPDIIKNEKVGQSFALCAWMYALATCKTRPHRITDATRRDWQIGINKPSKAR